MSESTDLVEFLRARLDENERHAEKDIWAADNATEASWRALYGVNLPTSEIEGVASLYGPQHQADALLIGRFKPATVRRRGEHMLVEVNAKRRIIANIELARTAMESAPIEQQVAATDGPAAAYWRGQDFVLRLLALPYADHPDYRDEWKP